MRSSHDRVTYRIAFSMAMLGCTVHLVYWTISLAGFWWAYFGTVGGLDLPVFFGALLPQSITLTLVPVAALMWCLVQNRTAAARWLILATGTFICIRTYSALTSAVMDVGDPVQTYGSVLVLPTSMAFTLGAAWWVNGHQHVMRMSQTEIRTWTVLVPSTLFTFHLLITLLTPLSGRDFPTLAPLLLLAGATLYPLLLTVQGSPTAGGWRAAIPIAGAGSAVANVVFLHHGQHGGGCTMCSSTTLLFPVVVTLIALTLLVITAINAELKEPDTEEGYTPPEIPSPTEGSDHHRAG